MRVLLTISLLVFAFQIQSQKTKQFLDDSGNEQGIATYYGTWQDTILPKSGYFTFNWREIEAPYIKTYSTKGFLKNNQPNNTWEWQQSNLKVSINPGKNIQPIFKTSGELAKWRGRFNEGKPNNTWTFSVDSIDENGRVVEKWIEGSIPYKNGQLIGKFQIEDKRKNSFFKLQGNCNEKGEAEGTWIFEFYNDSLEIIKEIHEYKQGVLLEVLIQEADSQTIIWDKNKWFFEVDTNLKINAKVGDSLFLNTQIEGVSNNKYDLLLKEKFLSGWNIPEFSFENPFTLPIFRRIEFPVSESEKEWISKTKSLLDSTYKKIDENLQGELYIQKSRSANLDLSISYLQKAKERIELVDSLLNRVENPYFTYKNRFKKGNLKYLENVNESAEVTPEVYDTSTLWLPLISLDVDSFELFKMLYEVTNETAKSVEPYFELIENEIISLDKMSERKELEEILSTKLDTLKKIFKNEQGLGLIILNKWIEGDLQGKIKNYAQIDEHNQAMQQGNAILQRMDTIFDWHEKVELFDSMPQKIEAEYTRFVYNPYTGNNDLEMIVKRRFLNAITSTLWPWLEENIYETDDWTNFNQLWEQQFKVFDFVMVFASREDNAAQRLNKRVRKESSPEKILRLIN